MALRTLDPGPLGEPAVRLAPGTVVLAVTDDGSSGRYASVRDAATTIASG